MNQELNLALEKLKAEIDKPDAGDYVKYVGDYLIGFITGNPQYAGYILEKDKTVAGSYKHMENVARKKPRKGSGVFLTPEEGFDAVLEYFGINDKKPVLSVVADKKKVDLSLDSLL